MMKFSRQDDAHAEAAIWVARLQREDAQGVDIVAGLQRWLAEDVRHQQAFEQASTIWEMLGGVDRGLLDRKPAFTGYVQHYATLAACLFLATFFLLSGPQVRPQHVATAVGAQRTVVLSDGTEVTLNTDSAIQIHYSGAGRYIRLLSGEALFDVAHDADRPFHVRYPGGRIRNIGTKFLVRSTSGQSSVTLIEGELAVRPQQGTRSTGEEAFLKPGERYRVDFVRNHLVIDRPSVAALTSWKDGRAIFDGIPIRTAAEEMNRYAPHIRVVVESELGNLPISGVFSTRQPYAFAAAVSSVHGLALHEVDDVLYLTSEKNSEKMSGNGK